MRLVVVGLCAVICASSTQTAVAQTPARRVLLLYSYEREFTHITFAGLFRPELGRASRDPIDFIEVSLQPARSSLSDPDASTLEAVRAAFAGRGLDLVVPLGGPAASFAQ